MDGTAPRETERTSDVFSSGARRSGKRKKKRQRNANIFLPAGETHEAFPSAASW